MNEYSLDFSLKSNAARYTDTIRASSEQDARNLLRSKFNGQEVRIYSGRMTEFGGGRNDRDRRDDRR